jgi:hypothetical protein
MFHPAIRTLLSEDIGVNVHKQEDIRGWTKGHGDAIGER